MKRVVITGIGAVTPVGNNIERTWENLVNKVSGTGMITRFDPYGLPSRIAAELKGFDPEDYISGKDLLRLDPFVHYAAAAALMAVDNAGMNSEARGSAVLERAGVIIGSSRGGISSMERSLERHVSEGKPISAYLMSASTISMASSYVSLRLGAKGPSLGISTACASGTNAIGEAMRMIRCGDADVVLAGGAEAPVCRLAVGGYGSAGALSQNNDNPATASRPFDLERDGFVIAEGSCVLVLEELEHARRRGAEIYAELAGYGSSSDAFHQTQPDSEGEAGAMKQALQNARLSADEIEYINAHATSTPLGDSVETEAIRDVFGAHADTIDISSCKSMLGHMLGAAGAVEVAVTALSVSRDLITPTINLDRTDPSCNLSYVTTPKQKKLNAAMTNSFGFGGVNAVLVLKKYRG